MKKIKEISFENAKVYKNKDYRLIDQMLGVIGKIITESLNNKNVYPVLSRFDFPNESQCQTDQEDVLKFIKKIESKFNQRNRFYRLFVVREEEKNIHYHGFIVFNSADFGHIRRIKSELQKVWESINRDNELFMRTEDNYFYLNTECERYEAYERCSYLAKIPNKRLKFQNGSIIGKGQSSPKKKSVKEREMKIYWEAAGDYKKELNIDYTSQRFIRVKEVCNILAIGRSTFYAGIKKEIFPSPYKIGRSSVWKLDEILKLVYDIAN